MHISSLIDDTAYIPNEIQDNDQHMLCTGEHVIVLLLKELPWLITLP